MSDRRGVQRTATLSSTNGDRPSAHHPTKSREEEQRATNVKRAMYFLAIALFLILADWFGHGRWAALPDSDRTGVSGITLAVNQQRPSKDGKAFAIQFRLSNSGKHSIYYPLCEATGTPASDIFYRTSETTTWTLLTQGPQADVAILPKCPDSSLAWIEMPPGGWVDGEVLDGGGTPGDHAIGFQIRIKQDSSSIAMLSHPYRISR